MTRKQRFALLATIIGSGVVFLDGTVVNLALPAIARDLNANFSDLQWIADASLLSLSALILLGGSLGDIYGRKRIYLIGLAGFTVTSLLAGLAPSTAVLIAIRVLEGLFGALLVPGALAIIETNFEPGLRSRAFGLWTAWSAAITAVGPLLGGYLVDIGSWRWIFFINVPLLLICFWLARVGVTESHHAGHRRLDFGGAILAMLALLGVTYGLIEGPTRHWDMVTILSLAIGTVLFLAFLWREEATGDPMLSLSLFRSRNFDGANLTTLAMYGALYGFMFALLLQLQQVVGFSSLKAGLSLLPLTLILLILSPRVGRWNTKWGPRWLMTIGPLISAVGILWLGRLTHGSTYFADVLPGIALFGVGMSLTVTPLTATVMGSVRQTQAGIASAVNNAVARVAGLMFIALLGLFGVSRAYGFAVVMCTGLAVLAGLASFLIIQNRPTVR